MPKTPPKTKAGKQRAMRSEMRRFEAGKLHAGKSGKIVKSRAQAIAIGLRVSGLSRRKSK